jgi:hypothetical protein
MKDERRPDYRRAKLAVLQTLAGAGDSAAIAELNRRGVAIADFDVTKLDAAALASLVNRWQEGVLPDDRAASRALAVRAHAELSARYRVDLRLWDGRGVAPQPPLIPHWRWPRPPRSVPWQRPAGSTIYPSDHDRTRAQIGALAREVYAARTGK